jgi:flavin-dependent dehydrogenase
MEKVDVVVIGAGPAGAVASSIIHQAGFSVRVVEREKFPRFQIGESLLPRCMNVLEDAGLLEAVKAKNFQQKFGAKFMKGNLISDFQFADQYTSGWSWTWQVPRADFDLALIDEAQRKGVAVDFETTVTGIEFFKDESSITTVTRQDGSTDKIKARFVVDASGYGRVIPRLFNLNKPSNLDPRKAVFAHVSDVRRNEYDEPNRIIIVNYAPGTWVWIIPFSTGITSLGFVGSFDFFALREGDLDKLFTGLIEGNEYLKTRFGDATRVFAPRKLEAWSASTDKFNGHGYVLTGNATEFLDPVFSSGVMFATVSSQRAAMLVVRKLQGETIDWDNDYTSFMQRGVDTFRTYVMAWYDGTLEKIFYARHPDPEIKRQICSVLAGYVWDLSNPYVRDHKGAIYRLARLIEKHEKLL